MAKAISHIKLEIYTNLLVFYLLSRLQPAFSQSKRLSSAGLPLLILKKDTSENNISTKNQNQTV